MVPRTDCKNIGTEGSFVMVPLPRLAVGALQPDLDLQPLIWALLDQLLRYGLSCQVFLSQSRLQALDGTWTVSGKRQRHLDSWLMEPEHCRWAFFHGCRDNDLSLVTGEFVRDTRPASAGGSLNSLCEWLELPRIGVLDLSRMDPCQGWCSFCPLSGLVLVGAESSDQLVRWQTTLESLADVPILGGFGPASELADALAGCRARGCVTRDLCDSLGAELGQQLRLDRLLAVARAAAPLQVREPTWWNGCGRKRTHVAVAYDDAFNCYYPDTLDWLDASGARVSDFSPLKGEKLPEDADLVWFGCGHPERFAHCLAGNACMQQSLQAHVRAGGRVYAEGGGLAYICRTMICDAGRFPMAGLLPACARFCPQETRPVELDLAFDSWLDCRKVRGYLNGCWSVEAEGPLLDYSASSACPWSLVGHRQVIGSRIHMHFAAQPRLFWSLLHPRRVSP
jgi:cobyrinic acid a,c-diamide synthase